MLIFCATLFLLSVFIAEMSDGAVLPFTTGYRFDPMDKGEKGKGKKGKGKEGKGEKGKVEKWRELADRVVERRGVERRVAAQAKAVADADAKAVADAALDPCFAEAEAIAELTSAWAATAAAIARHFADHRVQSTDH